MLGEIKEWRDPVKRGKRVFDDREFAESLSGQYTARKTLTPRQIAAMKKLIASYSGQIADFAVRAERLGIQAKSAGKRSGKGGVRQR